VLAKSNQVLRIKEGPQSRFYFQLEETIAECHFATCPEHMIDYVDPS
jgi:hypothetical protein